MDSVKEKLSIELNKPVTDNFVDTLREFVYKNDLPKFQVYCQVLGFPNDDFIREVYGQLKSIKKKEIVKETVKDTSKEVVKETVKEIETDKEKAGPKKKQKLISFEEDDLFMPIKPKVKTTKFKKIKKEDALRFKGESGTYSGTDTERGIERNIERNIERKITDTKSEDLSIDKVSVSTVSTPSSVSSVFSGSTLSLRDLAQQESLSKDPTIDIDISDVIDPNNDREWYMGEEYDVYEEPEEALYKPKNTVKKPRQQKGRTGGQFNEHGEYIDHDHEEQTDDTSNLNIISYYFVPPFLADSEDHISVKINQGSATFAKGISSDFSPVKNANSHLAILAKQGSSVVNELRSNKEKKKQAQERAGIAGSNLGNVLGIKQEQAEIEPQEEHEEESIDMNTITSQRRSLPVYSVRADLVQIIADNQVIIIMGETGSGKTTQLAQYLYEEGYAKSLSRDKIKKQIGCTQPRRVAAMSVAKRVSEEFGCKLGEEVGYVIRFEDHTSHDKTLIKYMTEGILLRELLVDSNLDAYSCIIMDEAHERTVSTDLLLGLLRLLVMRRKDFKLIVTSATMNADKFTQFFGNAPQFHIPGRTFPVDVYYNRSVSDYVDASVKQVITIHLQNLNEQNESDGDILVFLTGQEDIEVCCELIREKLEELGGVAPLDIYPIYSTLPSDLQKKIFRKSNKLRRKVVIATNIAETSLTVDGVRYVIDCGLVKMKIYNPKLGMDTLQSIPISQANANQRSGRAGRTAPGKAFRLYSEKEMKEDLNLMPIPEIQRTNLNNVMLLLKSLSVDNISDFPFIDPPPKDILACSLYELWSIGALDNVGNLTKLGHQMTEFPIEASLAKLILLASQPQFKCSFEVLLIVSMLTVPNVFVRPKERIKEADLAREKFNVEESDHLTLSNVYQQWESQLRKPGMSLGKLVNWSNKNFLNNKSLLRAKDIKNQLILIMKKCKLPLLKSQNDEDIKRCLCACFFHQSAKISKLNLTNSNQIEYLNLRHTFMKLYLHPVSCLNNSTTLPPSYVIYHELILTSKEYMNCVTAVDPLWLLEFGYIFFGVSKLEAPKLSKLQLQFDVIDQQFFQRILNDDAEKYREQNQSKQVKKSIQRDNKINSKFKRRGI